MFNLLFRIKKNFKSIKDYLFTTIDESEYSVLKFYNPSIPLKKKNDNILAECPSQKKNAKYKKRFM